MIKNPFSNRDIDREYLWDMIVYRDIKAFVNQDWDMIKDDFHEAVVDGINLVSNSLTYHKQCEYKSGEIGGGVSTFVQSERSIYIRS